MQTDLEAVTDDKPETAGDKLKYEEGRGGAHPVEPKKKDKNGKDKNGKDDKKKKDEEAKASEDDADSEEGTLLGMLTSAVKRMRRKHDNKSEGSTKKDFILKVGIDTTSIEAGQEELETPLPFRIDTTILMDDEKNITVPTIKDGEEGDSQAVVVVQRKTVKVGDNFVVIQATVKPGEMTPEEIESFPDMIPDEVDALFSPDGKFLGMEARISEVKKFQNVETIALMLQADKDSPTMSFFLDLVRDEKGVVVAVRMLDTHIPGIFLKDVGKFLNSLSQ